MNILRIDVHDNPKMFWKYHKSIFHHRSSLNPTITFNNCTAKSPKEKAELFNTCFCSVFRAAQTAMSPDASISLITSSSQLSDITISEEVATHLCNLDISKATGPDGIPNWILKELMQCHYRSKSMLTFQPLPSLWYCSM